MEKHRVTIAYDDWNLFCNYCGNNSIDMKFIMNVYHSTKTYWPVYDVVAEIIVSNEEYLMLKLVIPTK